VPDTDAYHMREKDAVPDEVAVIPEGQDSCFDTASNNHPPSPRGHSIPMTIVEDADPSPPSHGEGPGTLPHERFPADAVPNLVFRTGEQSQSSSTRSRSGSTPADLPIPVTKVERIDSKPSHGEVPGTKAYETRKGDAKPDMVEEIREGAGIPASLASQRLTESESPTSPVPRPPVQTHVRRKSSVTGKKAAAASPSDYNEAEDGSDGGFGDDFDDFEEGEEDTEFGDFDDGFQEAAASAPHPQSLPAAPLFVSSRIIKHVHVLLSVP
jgi:hypothetical protein